VLEFVRSRGAELDANRLELLALPDRFIDHGQRTEQLTDAGLDLDQLSERIATRVVAAQPMASVRLATSN